MYRQSAVLPYRWHEDELEVLLITSRKRRHWIVPKGIVEPHLTPAESAVSEALEEAGIRGEIAPNAIGSYRHPKWHGVCDIEVFPFRVSTELDDWEESALRQRRWFTVAEAAGRVHNAELASLISRLPGIVSPERIDGDDDPA